MEHEYDLSARPLERASRDPFEDALIAAAGSQGEVCALSRCATIQGGTSINASALMSVEDKGSLPYVRIKDIQNGEITHGSNWIRESHEAKIRGKQLQLNDVLLSKSGTIGKAGIVREGAAGGIAANGLYVLRTNPARLDPAYLLAYLGSSACQKWLDSNAHGSVIRHLNRPYLAKLPVPVPPLPLQQLAVAQHREFGTDALEFLAVATRADTSAGLCEWLSRLDELIPASIDDYELPLRCFDPAGNHAAAAESLLREDSDRHPWATRLVEVLRTLHKTSDIPDGASLVSLLQQAERRLLILRFNIRSYFPIECLARDVVSKLSSALRSTYKHLMSAAAVRVEFALDSAGTHVNITNAGPLPLRAFVVTSTPDLGQLELPFFRERKTHVLVLFNSAPERAQWLEIEIQWSGRTLAGVAVDGRSQFRLKGAGNRGERDS